MDTRTCRSCGRLFNYITGQPICPACKDELEKKFQQVKQYIWDHKGATMDQISEDNDVSVKQLKNWVKEERLTFSDDSPISMTCENCGAEIKTGRFCASCKTKLGNSIAGAIHHEDPTSKYKDPRDNKNKMRFL